MGRKLKYQLNGFYRIDDRSGFAQRAYNTREEWNGLIVDQKLWEPRHPQDFVKGVKDDQTVPKPRPLAPDTFAGPIYVPISANVAIGATFIPLSRIAGISAGDSVAIMMDTGMLFRTTVSGNPISTGVNIASPIPYTASEGNLMIDYDA